MRLTAEHMKMIEDTVAGIAFGRVTIEINETSQTVDIIAEKRIRMAKEIDTTPRAGKIIRVPLPRKE